MIIIFSSRLGEITNLPVKTLTLTEKFKPGGCRTLQPLNKRCMPVALGSCL